MREICKSTFLAKTLKIAIFPKENAYFQEIKRPKKKDRAKIEETSHVFWEFHFGWILNGLGGGFGRPKSTIFAFFFV